MNSCIYLRNLVPEGGDSMKYLMHLTNPGLSGIFYYIFAAFPYMLQIFNKFMQKNRYSQNQLYLLLLSTVITVSIGDFFPKPKAPCLSGFSPVLKAESADKHTQNCGKTYADLRQNIRKITDKYTRITFQNQQKR